MSGLAHKFRYLNSRVNVWTKNKTLDMKKESFKINEDINSFLTAFPSGILSLQDMNTLHALKDRKNLLMTHELLTWQLKRRTKWNELGDANTKFFHSIASSCRNFNSIWSLKNKEDK